MTIEEGLEQLESGIKRLKVQYDMFFMRSLQRQPYELRRHVDHLIRTMSNAEIKKYHHRFQLNTLVGRYNAFCELWGKHLRTMEEGGRATAAAALAASQAPSRTAEDAERVYFTVQVSDPLSEPETMRTLYEHYLEARQTISGGRPALKLESFVKQIASQASSLQQSSGCKSIEFRVLRKGDAVSLKARAAAQESSS